MRAPAAHDGLDDRGAALLQDSLVSAIDEQLMLEHPHLALPVHIRLDRRAAGFNRAAER